MPISNWVLQYRRWIIIAFHAGMIVFGYWLAYLLRFEFRLSSEDQQRFVRTLPLILIVRLTFFAWYHLYEGLWRYVSMRDILAILKAVTLSSLAFSATVLVVYGGWFPPAVLVLDWLLCLALVGGVRLTIRAFGESGRQGQQAHRKRALIVGAGDGGEMLIREIERNLTMNYEVVGFVDDEPRKQGRRIHGIEVLGAIDALPVLCAAREVQELIIAIPSASGEQMRRIIAACRAAKVECKTVPRLAELLENSFGVSRVRRVNIEDLLRREPVRIDQTEVENFIRGKRVLVTGAGGSIGSELCRQIARFKPAALILLERAENNLFFAEFELREKFPGLRLLPVIADVTDEERMVGIFREHMPEIVFHAAAHKHVPLMEANKSEAVKNNVLGTMVVARTAERHGAEHFVMISTDKAVRPTSVMGATKRLAELYVQALNSHSNIKFTTVRFGNVLGSEGSVLQVFQRQIEAGGPVTVTHPEMMRYFMTIPEACQLVLQAAAQGKGGETFVLDMGDPVRIVDLAKDLITLSGLEPGRDIEIKFTGPRPGEKLFEELLNPETRVLPTPHEKIMVVQAEPLDLDGLKEELSSLIEYAQIGDEKSLLAKLAALVPGYLNGHAPELMPQEKLGRILLLGKDAYTRMTLRRILQPRYAIFEAEGETEALQQVHAGHPNLVILDFHLPEVNVRKLCARLKRANGDARLPLIVLANSSFTFRENLLTLSPGRSKVTTATSPSR